MDVPFAALDFEDRVVFCPKTETVEPGGDSYFDYAPTGDPIPCRVRRLNTRVIPKDEVDKVETTHELAFPSDPGAVSGDQFSWLDDDGAEIDRLAVNARARPTDRPATLWLAYAVIVE